MIAEVLSLIVSLHRVCLEQGQPCISVVSIKMKPDGNQTDGR